MYKFDDDFIIHLMAGDTEAERKLVAFFKTAVRNWIRKRVPKISEQDCEDLISEMTFAALTSLKRGQYNKSSINSLTSYIFGIARNKLSDHIKYKKLVFSSDPAELPEGKTEFMPAVEDEQIKMLLRIALFELPDKYRHVLFLKYYEKLPVAQIGEVIGIPAQKVSERLNYGLKLLQKKIKKEKKFSILKTLFGIL